MPHNNQEPIEVPYAYGRSTLAVLVLMLCLSIRTNLQANTFPLHYNYYTKILEMHLHRYYSYKKSQKIGKEVLDSLKVEIFPVIFRVSG